MKGYIKFHRAMLEHPVWRLSPGQRCVWLTCLALANFKRAEWWDGRERVEILPGTFITSQLHLAEAAGVSRKVARDAIQTLFRLGSIRAKPRAKRWTLIDIVNWPIYQGPEEEQGQAEGQVRAKQGPSEGHNVRMEEGKNEKKVPPAAGLTLDEYLAKHSPEDQAILRQTVQAIASTRRAGKVAPSVLDSQATKWSRFPAAVVLQACRIYLDRRYADQGKGEAYLLGIMRQEAKRATSRITGQDERHGEAQAPAPLTPTPKTAGQRAIDRALADLQAAKEPTS